MKPILSKLVRVIATLSAAGIVLAAQAEPITPVHDLHADAQRARADQKPIVLFMTASYCEFCEVLREEVFQFLPSDERFILREVIKDHSKSSVLGFDGRPTSQPKLADDFGISLTPTVLFVDADGKQLTEPMVGVLTLDYYNYYFDQAVEQSSLRLKQQKVSHVDPDTDATHQVN